MAHVPAPRLHSARQRSLGDAVNLAPLRRRRGAEWSEAERRFPTQALERHSMGGWAVAVPAANGATGSVRNVKVCVVNFGVLFF